MFEDSAAGGTGRRGAGDAQAEAVGVHRDLGTRGGQAEVFNGAGTGLEWENVWPAWQPVNTLRWRRCGADWHGRLPGRRGSGRLVVLLVLGLMMA